VGRKIVISGALVMATGMALILAAVQRYGPGLHPWQLIPGLVIAGLGMAMVAGTLTTIVLAKIPTQHSGAASSLINTTIQVGVAAGVALVGTIYFGELESSHQAVPSAVVGLLAVIGLYILAALLALILPPGPVTVIEDSATDPGAPANPTEPGGPPLRLLARTRTVANPGPTSLRASAGLLASGLRTSVKSLRSPG
jgi:MFS family permease